MDREDLSKLAERVDVRAALGTDPSEQSADIEIRPTYDGEKQQLEVQFWGNLDSPIIGTNAAVLDERGTTVLAESLTAYAGDSRSFAGEINRNDMARYSGQVMWVLVVAVDRQGGLFPKVARFPIPRTA